jgi:Ca2+-binding RTX toxin-like protein
MRSTLPLAATLLALLAPGVAAAHDRHSPDAEIFASNNTAVITDPADPRLDDDLKPFARTVERLVRDGGGSPRGSRLLDGVFSGDAGTTTFERSREFDVDDVTDDELATIADTVRSRFGQQSVLTFDRLRPDDERVDAIELEVPGVTAAALRDGLLADATARERLFGGSVTQDGHLLLVAAYGDGELARSFAGAIGGDLDRATMRFGARSFVEGPSPVRVAHRTLVIDGGADGDTIGLRARHGRVLIDLDADGSAEFAIARHRFDRIRVSGGEGIDTLALEGSDAGERFGASAAGAIARLTSDRGDLRIDADGVEILRVAAGGGADALTVGDLSATDVFQVDGDLGEGDGAVDRATVAAGSDDDQVSVTAFSGAAAVLGPTFVQLQHPERSDRLTVEARGGDDIVSTSTDLMATTLDGGDGSDVLLGGPGDDLLLGGADFDDVSGGRGNDTARLGGDFDRFKWAPGDGSDDVDGGASRDSLFFQGTGAAEAFDLAAEGHGLRLRRDVDGVAMRLDRLEEIDTVAGGGADSFAVGDLTGTPAQLVDVSLGDGRPGGDEQPDRVAVTGTDGRDDLALTGSVVVAGTATLRGLPATVNVSHAEGALDTLAIDTRAGDDRLDTSAFDPATIGLDVGD